MLPNLLRLKFPSGNKNFDIDQNNELGDRFFQILCNKL